MSISLVHLIVLFANRIMLQNNMQRSCHRWFGWNY